MLKKILLFILFLALISQSIIAAENKSIVAIVKVDGDMAAAISKGLELAGDLASKIEKRDRVVIKASVDKPRKDAKGHATNPDVLKELIRIGKKQKARRHTIVEGVVGGDSYKAFNQAGYTAMAKKEKALLKSMDSGKYWNSWVPDGNSFKKYLHSTEVIRCEVYINVPVLKYDEASGASLSLKNNLGIIYGKSRKKRFLKAKNLDEVIVDLNIIRPSDIVVIDGTTVILEDGKTKKDLDIIIVSSDPLAADVVGAKILGLDPRKIRHIQIAEKRGIGNADMKNIKVVGEKIESIQKLLKK